MSSANDSVPLKPSFLTTRRTHRAACPPFDTARDGPEPVEGPELSGRHPACLAEARVTFMARAKAGNRFQTRSPFCTGRKWVAPGETSGSYLRSDGRSRSNRLSVERRCYSASDSSIGQIGRIDAGNRGHRRQSGSGFRHRPRRARLCRPATCSGPNASSRSRTAPSGWRTRAAASSASEDGEQQIITQRRSEHFDQAGSEATRYLEGTLPNGLAFARNGDILISNFGTDCLELMSRDGASRVLADSIDGEPIGKVNFVLRDSRDRIWITVSTRVKNWMHALRTDLADGYLARYENGTFHIVADGFRFTNEIRFDASEEFMYVVETTGGRITRLRIDERGNLRDREVFGPSTLGQRRVAGRDRLRQLRQPLGHAGLFRQAVRADAGRRHARAARRRRSGEGRRARAGVLPESGDRGRAVRHRPGGRSLDGERDLRRPGSAHRLHRIAQGQRIPYFRAPVAGLPMVHWHERLQLSVSAVSSTNWQLELETAYLPSHPPSTNTDCPVR